MKWISANEKKPHAEYGEGETVLTINELGVVHLLYWDGSNWCEPTGECYDSQFKVTHWMPLPGKPGDETIIHCNIEKNARLIAMILDFDEEGKEFDWFEQHIENAAKHYEERIEKLLNPPVFPDCSPIVTTLPDNIEGQIDALEEDSDVKLALSYEGNVTRVLEHLDYLKKLKARGEAVRKAGWEAPNAQT